MNVVYVASTTKHDDLRLPERDSFQSNLNEKETTWGIQWRPHHFAPNTLDFASDSFHAVSPNLKNGSPSQNGRLP